MAKSMTLHLCLRLLTAGLLFSFCQCQCDYPSDLEGTWYSSHESNAEQTWTSTNVTSFSYTTQGAPYNGLTYECFINDGSYYVSRTTTTINIFTVEYYVYTCWVFKKRSSNKYIYYHAVSPLEEAQDARIKILPTTTSITLASEICDMSVWENYDYSLLLRNGTASTEKVSCPSPLLATGTYTISDSSTTYCDGNSWLDGCSASGTLTANYTVCSTEIFYSSEGELYCMNSNKFSSSESGTYYVNLWNTEESPDESSTFYFTCLVVDSTSSGVYMTQYPGDCLNASYMNATYISEASGFNILLNTNTTCAPSSGDNLGLILGVVFGLIVVIALCVVLGCLYYHYVYLKKKTRPSSKVVPDTLPNTAMSQADKNKRMMFTPAPPRSAGPGGRQNDYYDGGRPGSELSLHPTVSQLANYRTPTPFISDSKVEEGIEPTNSSDPRGQPTETDTSAKTKGKGVDTKLTQSKMSNGVSETAAVVIQNEKGDKPKPKQSKTTPERIPSPNEKRPTPAGESVKDFGYEELSPPLENSSPIATSDTKPKPEEGKSEPKTSAVTGSEKQDVVIANAFAAAAIETKKEEEEKTPETKSAFRDVKSDKELVRDKTFSKSDTTVEEKETPKFIPRRQKSKGAFDPTRSKSAHTRKPAAEDVSVEDNDVVLPSRRADTMTPINRTAPDDIQRIKSADMKRLASERKKRVALNNNKNKLPKKEKKELPAFFSPESSSLFLRKKESQAWSTEDDLRSAAGSRSSKDFDDDSILDFDMKRLGEPDGAESGVMVDMEGSLPVFSDSGDLTPEPTRVTPRGRIEKTPRRPKPTSRTVNL